MKIIEITHHEYIETYNDLKPLISLHSCYTEGINNQMTAWCLNNCDDWFLKFETVNGDNSYFKQVKKQA